MLSAPKTLVGAFTRKVIALVMSYSFLATSVWSMNLPGRTYRGASHRVSLNALRGPIGNWLAANAARAYDAPATSGLHNAIQPKIFNNFAELRAAEMAQSGGGSSTTVSFFGPQQYVRTTGDPNTYTTTVHVPSWVVNPFNLHIQNGEADGSFRVSSATIMVNNVQVAGTSDFNQQVFTLDRSVTLTPTTTLVVTLASKPGSYLRINLGGVNGDHTPPVVTIAAPAAAINTPQAHFDIQYQDLPGAGEPAASGVNTSTLKVLIDGVDRTNLFTVRTGDASADLPASLALAQGPHNVSASIQDNAGNTGQASLPFEVDTTPPRLQIVQPVAGSYLNSTTPQIVLAYGDNFALNLTSLKVTNNGIDITSAFTKTASGASGTAPALAQGGNTIVATISDQAGNQTTASVSFNVDTTAPTIAIVHPATGSKHGSANVEYLIQYSDDQAIDPSTLAVTVDGSPVAVTAGATGASGSVTLGNSTGHVLSASIKDKAGNPATASSTFTVDTTFPNVHIIQPVNNSFLNNSTPAFQVQYTESISGVDTTTFKASVDGADVTSLFSVGTSSASATLQTPLADGSHTFSAQIASAAGNVGQASNQVLIDTIKPQLTIVSPAGAVNTTTPLAAAQYSDSGSGIDATSVHVTLDGVDVTGTFGIGSSSATGTLGSGAGLSEGTHQLAVSVADKAGNVAQASSSFLVDVTPPAALFSSPANNSFINNAQPVITLAYSDSGSGVDPNSIHVFLQQGTAAETEITSLFTFGAAQGTATIPASSPLVPGTYHLRAVVADKAGNQATPTSTFALDTTPPTYTIVAPAANAFLNTATPTFIVNYQDDSSGVDTSKFVLLVDGVDRTNRLTLTAAGASGALLPSDALADGTHQLSVTVVDRAGNAAPVVPQSFLVDTTPPTISITSPAVSSFTNNNHTPIAVTYSDSGSGIDVTTFQLLIDGVDHTAEFTVSPTGASGATAAALLDGSHTITANIKDLAGNPATTTTLFTVDTVPPVITIAQPAAGTFTNAASILVSGSVTAGAPVTVTVEGSAAPLQAGVFTATVALGAGPTQIIHVTATDAAGNTATATVTVNIDRTPPVITTSIAPPPNAAGWNNTNVVVTFTCSDSDSGVATCPSPVNVSTEGAGQIVNGQALDKAGNTAQASVTLNIDKTPPVITATAAPPANAAGWNTTPVTVTYVCSDSLSGVVLCPAPQVVSTDGKAQVISASVSDVAGNTASAPVTLNIEQGSPAITSSLSPPANAAGWNNTNVTVNFVCTPSVSGIVTCQAPSTISTEGKNQTVTGTVTDQAGKTATTVATVSIDKTPPVITASAAPPANAAGWNKTPVAVSYVCSDSLSGVAVCPPSTTVSTEGASQSISAQATDQAGNTATVSTILNIDMTPPVVTVTATPPANGAGWNNSKVTVTFNCADNLSGLASCTAQQIEAGEGQNQNISGPATDVAGNTATGSIILSIDKTPPTIVQVSTPTSVSQLHPGQVSVTVNDNFTVTQVVISVNGTPIGTFTTPPYQTTLQVPAGANPGDTLTVTVVATDEAGNTQTASRGVSVASEGVVVGQVLSDTTSFPVPGASVQVISATGQSGQTDGKGRYSFQASDAHLFVSVTGTASTTVEREVFVQAGAGTVAVDARLTPRATGTTIGSAGGTLTAGAISMTVPAASVPDGTTFKLTPLSGQGLPNLLPLGWSPLAAFDFRSSAAASNLGAVVANLPNTVMHLVTYSSGLHAWTMVATNLQSVNGAVNFSVPGAGAYALVIPDVTTPPVPIPAVGGPLTGVAVQALNPAVTGSGSLNPPVLPAGGGTSTATLVLQSPSFAPSGTLLQANVSERFSLASGDVVSEETRSEDIVVYNSPAAAGAAQSMSAQFPVTPSHRYANAQLVSGNIHLDILAGREGVRGQPGGNDPVTVSDGVATLSVPGGALAQDTAIAVQSTTLENFVPTTSSMGALQEVIVDFSGEILNTPAQLSIPATGLNPNDTFLLTQVQRLNGVPHMVAAALAQINGGNLTSVASPGLPGIAQGGEYVFYDISAPVGFVQGVAASTAGPVQALVQTDSLQIVSITGVDGRYIVPALAGTVNLKANGTTSSVAGTASTTLTAGQTAVVNIQLNGVVNTATVTPADGSLGVPVSAIISVTSPVPMNPQSVVQTNISLFQGTPGSPGAAVALQPFALSTSGTVLTLAPVQNLSPATQYTLQVSGLADTGGGAVVVPASTFSTQASQQLTFDPNAITFAFPDASGNIHVSVPAGSLAPGTKVTIVDQTNAVVLSLTVFNDGSLSGDFPGTINDVLQVTVTDPTGATTTFTRSQFVAADGSVAVGPGGGTVTGPGGVELRIPTGALDQGVTFKIAAFGPDLFPERPDAPTATFAGGIKITTSVAANFKKEVKLAFPMPAGVPSGAFFQVYRRLQGPNTQFAFEDLDYALVENPGTPNAKIVTASFPFRGLIDLNNLLAQAAFLSQTLGAITDIGGEGAAVFQAGLDNIVFALWTVSNALPGISLGGVVTGRVRFAVQPGGTLPDGTINKTGDVVFSGVPNVAVHVDNSTSSHAIGTGDTVAMTQPDGSFTFSDPHYNGGTINLIATDGAGNSVQASAIEVVSLTDKTVNDFAGPLLKFYRNVAFADIVLPPPPPPAPKPQIGISFFTEDPTTKLRVPVNGIVASGTNLVIAFKTNGQIPSPPSVRINNTSYATQVDQPSSPGDPNTLDFELSQPFVPGAPGIYTLTVTGLTPFLQSITASKSFFVIAAGGSNNQINVGVPPIIASVTPQAGSVGVPITTFVQVQFSEPVTNLPGHVRLVPDDGSPSPTLKLSGIDYRDGVTVISNLAATDAVASMTIEPSELKYNTHYTLVITSDVVDLDNVADPTKPALPLVQPQDQKPPQLPYDFFTFGPTQLGSTSAFPSTRPVVFGNRAYVGVPLSGLVSELNTYDVSDPTNPQLLPEATFGFTGRPMDLAGEQTAAVINNGSLIAVGSGFAGSGFLMPSNLWLFDVSTDQIKRVGGISVTSSAVNVGQILRVTLHGNFAYTSTFPVGINVVDLQQGISDYQSVFSTNPVQFGVAVTTDGQGFATDAVVNTIPVLDSNGKNAMLMGIQAGDFLVAGSDPLNPTTQTLVVATGRMNSVPSASPFSFAVADPTQPGSSALLYSGALQKGNFVVNGGLALALGQINVLDSNGNPVPKPLAIVVGYGLAPDPQNPGQTKTSVMAVVDMSVPSAPQVLSMVGLSDAATDVVLKDNLAIVGEVTKTELFDLTDPTNPFESGSIQGVGGLLSLNGFLYSSSFSTLPGLHVTALGALAFVKSFVPKVIEVSAGGIMVPDVTINYAVIPPDPTLSAAEVHIDVDNGSRAATLPGPLTKGTGAVVWPKGFHVDTLSSYSATVHVQSHGAELPTVKTRVPLLKVPLVVIPNDRMLQIQVALPDQQLFVDQNGKVIDSYSINVFLNGSASPALHIASSDIDNAYVNTDVWFSTTKDGTGPNFQDGSTQAIQSWVVRKIDQLAQVPGVTNPIRMQAFEIGTVFTDLNQVAVTVVSENTNTVIASLGTPPQPQADFANIIQSVNTNLAEAAPPGNGTVGNAGMIFRVLYALLLARTNFDQKFLLGLLKGFWFGLHSDISAVVGAFQSIIGGTVSQDIHNFFQNVSQAAHLLWEVGKRLKNLGVSGIKGYLKNVASSISLQFVLKNIDLLPVLAQPVGLACGYVTGFVLYLALQWALITFATAGFGAEAAAALDGGKAALWVARVLPSIAKLIRFLILAVDPIVALALDEATILQILQFIVANLDLFIQAVVTVYDFIKAVLIQPLIQILKTFTPQFVLDFLQWLITVQKMADEALLRFLGWVLKQAPQESKIIQRMQGWLAFARGATAIKDAFEIYDKIVEAADGAQDVLVKVDNAIGAAQLQKYVHTYEGAVGGDRVSTSLSRLEAVLNDTRFTDDVRISAVKVLSDFPAFSDDAVEGAGVFLSTTGGDLAADANEALLRRIANLGQQDGETLLDYIKNSSDPQVGKGFRRILEVGEDACVL